MSDGSGVIDLVHNVAYQTKGNKTSNAITITVALTDGAYSITGIA